jgi:hypothetical protein
VDRGELGVYTNKDGKHENKHYLVLLGIFLQKLRGKLPDEAAVVGDNGIKISLVLSESDIVND